MKDLITAVWNIFKYTGRFFTLIRNLFFNLLLLLLIAVLFIALLPREKTKIPYGSVLRLDITGDIVEEKKLISTLEKFLGGPFRLDVSEPETALQDILDIIEEGTDDDRVSVLLLNLKEMGHAGINQLENIGAALEDFKNSGKTVVAAEDFYTQSQYLLASYASRILLNPMGGVDIHGFGVYRLYFKDAVDRLGVHYNVFKVGSYKSALEPFTRNSMSPEDLQQNELWLSALWQVFTDQVTSHRKISLETLHNYTNNIDDALRATQGDPARLALDTGLVDQLATREELDKYLASQAGKPSGSPNIVASDDYFDALTPSYLDDGSRAPVVGLIIAEGTILPGKQPQGMIGGDSLATLIRKARENKDVKALVLRINSGGGSAFASEVIRQELLELKKSGKPVVVSMGTVAASGGYWIAADADQIWASPATITGSIGIFGAIPTFEKTLASVGVYRDGTGTTPLAAGLDLSQPLPEQLKSAIQQTIEYNYGQFLQIVAKGRKIEPSKVAELAEGRVYDGQSAKSLGLVDNLGSLEDAIDAAAGLAHLQSFETKYIQPPESVQDQFFQFLTTALAFFTKDSLARHPVLLGIRKSLINNLGRLPLLTDPRGVYAQCPINLAW